jgi:predicted ribosomally synthesized peptide with nif11-like leader
MPIVYVKEAPMKTLEEFIQRLQDDPAFEKQAHAFDHGDDLIAFVKREGYDFTLEQLTREFERAETSPAETGGLAPPPADVSPSPSPRPDEAEFPRQAEGFSSEESGKNLPKRGIDDFTREPPLAMVPQPKEAVPPAEAEAEPRAGLFRGGGGRHRGFSPQRLRSTSEEEP